MYDWDNFLLRMKAYPAAYHRFQPPCTRDRLQEMENELGTLPISLKAMLMHFNGARLFISAGESISIFGISTIPPLPPLEWAAEWCIDKFTPKWRAAGSGRESDWAVAMTNYGGLILLDGTERINEWDTGQSTWLSKNLSIGEWIENVIKEGEAMMADS